MDVVGSTLAVTSSQWRWLPLSGSPQDFLAVDRVEEFLKARAYLMMEVQLWDFPLSQVET
jgi:hypothetical protein